MNVSFLTIWWLKIKRLKIKKIDWVAFSAVSTAIMAFLTVIIIIQSYNNNKQNQQNNEILNRAYLSLKLIDINDEYIGLRIDNLGKTPARNLSFSLFDSTQRYLYELDQKPHGDLGPGDFIVFTTPKDGKIKDEIKKVKILYFKLKYNLYYGECKEYIIPIEFLEKFPDFKSQSSEEKNCE